jgi:hypothetical protein
MEGLLSLLESVEFEGLVIKEWNIVQFSKLSRVMTIISKEYASKNISWDEFAKTLSSTNMMSLGQGVMEFLAPFIEHAPAIITISCNVDQKFIEKMPYTQGLVAVLLIMKANLQHLNGFFGTLAAKTSSAVETTTAIDSPSTQA